MIHLDQLADEAIAVREQTIRRALADRDARVGTAACDDLHVAQRAVLTADWAATHPVLDQLAVDRETRLGRLYERGHVLARGAIVTAPGLTLEVLPDDPPLAHRYSVLAGTGRVAVAWVVTESQWAEPGYYQLAYSRGRQIYRRDLTTAVEKLASILATEQP